MKNAYEEADKMDWDREDRYQKEYCSLNSIYLMVMEEQHYNSPTPFDDTFRTECVRMTEWMIPLINEVYGTTYNEYSMIKLHENEQMLLTAVDANDLNQKGIPRKITDMTIEIEDCLYHLECQSDEDGTMLIRVVEYDLCIAARTAAYDKKKDTLTIRVPRSAVVFLRRDKSKAPMTVIYDFGDSKTQLTIPTISVQKYSMEEIFQKKLYCLIPFYFMRYERLFEQGYGLECEPIRTDLKRINEMLYELSISGEMPEIYVRDLVELTQTVLKQITRKLNDDERERIVKSMGGRVLEMESDRILERGRQEGRIEGIQEIILRAIDSLRENYSSDEVPIQLKKLFGLTDEEAARYMKM